jgi:hypothetical protein
MTIETVLEQIAGWCEDDWVGLWEIVAYVAEDLGVEDPEKQLELTAALVKELLKRGLRAGDSPLHNTGARFLPWRDQDPDTVTAFITQQWKRNDAYPSWGDGPWFATARLCLLHA